MATGWVEKDSQYTDIQGKPCTMMWYYRQRMFREPVLQHAGRLFNEWLVDSFCRIDDSRLSYYRRPDVQQKLRIATKDDLQHYCESIQSDPNQPKPGRILLPCSHLGSKRHSWQLLQNAYTLANRLGKATFFHTMTCNPDWPEIKQHLLPGQSYLDRPDIAARVFKRKLDRVTQAITSGRWHTRWQVMTNSDGAILVHSVTGEQQFNNSLLYIN